MKKNKVILPLLASLLFGCSSEASLSSSSASPLVYDELLEGEAAIMMHEEKVHLWWNDPSFDGYRIYGSKTRFGSYSILSGDAPLQTQNYVSEENRYGYFQVVGLKEGKEYPIGDNLSLWGSSMLIASPDDDLMAVQGEIDERHERLESGSDGQFSSERFGVAFLPGDYPDISMKLGYYSSAYGLGETPDETSVGELYVSTDVLGNNNATCTFWRNAENLSFPNPTQFAVSQATSLRRCHFRRNLALSHPSGWSSGGFLADCKIDGTVQPRTQQQWISRNDEMNLWSGSGHNYVFVGCEGGLPEDAWAENTSRTTVMEKTPKIAEMPFLYESQNSYYVFLPDVRDAVSGTSWDEGEIGDGLSLSIDRFYLARAEVDDADSLDRALKEKQGIIFTPGIYELSHPLHVENDNALLLGLGYATLLVGENNREGAVLIDDVEGFRLGGLLLDAGKKSDCLLRLGSTKSAPNKPAILSDLFCRLGGKENAHTEVDTMVVLNQGGAIGDNFWLWRADHSSGVAWEDYEERGDTVYGNPGQTGLRVEGDNVVCYGLMVEHFEGYQTIWNGEGGRTYMYQSEVPYRVPSQEKWMSHDGTVEGASSYKVGDHVQTHEAHGLGIYWVHYTLDYLDHAIEAPNNDGVRFRHLVTTTFTGYENGAIRHVINDVGETVGEGGIFRALIDEYPQKGEAQ
ncbi:MAG: hypothetical protein K6F32_06190 [Bacilli bacterium]|nr:hypothetical protein [Bacilli bacterium]